MIELPDITTDAGVVSRLIIAECENPGYADYTEADGQLSFRMMQACVVNRLNNTPSQFGAPGAQTLTDIITASNQFAGFSLSGGTVQMSQAVSDRIDAVMTNANTGAPGPYYQFVQDILTQVNGSVNDPLAGVTTINGTAVQGGIYGWRTVGSGDPGGSFFPIPAPFAGIVLGNQFYTLLAGSNDVGPRAIEAPAISMVFRSALAFVSFLKASGAPAGRTSLDGYIRRTEVDDHLLFSTDPASMPWALIRTEDVRRVEYFGGELHGEMLCAKVRLTI